MAVRLGKMPSIIKHTTEFNEGICCTFYVHRNTLSPMIKNFADKHTKYLFDRKRSRRFANIERVALRKLAMLHAAKLLTDLKVPPGNKLERLVGDRDGQYSIRINQQWRLCFNWKEGDIYDVEICDYH